MFRKDPQAPAWKKRMQTERLELLRKFSDLKRRAGTGGPATADRWKRSVGIAQHGLDNVKKKQKRQRDEVLANEIKFYIGRGRMAEAHNLCRQRGSTGIGVKKRDFRSAQSTHPTKVQ